MKKISFKVGIVCLLISALLLSGCQEKILHNLSEQEVNRLITLLDQKNIAAKKIKQPDGAWAIGVPSSQTIESIQSIEESRLLRNISKTEKEKTSLISSREEQRARIERGLSDQIQTTLASMPGVLEARVHLNLPPIDPLFGQILAPGSGSASVLLVTSQQFSFKKEQVAALVAGAAGLSTKKVTTLISHSFEAIKNGPTESASLKNQVDPVGLENHTHLKNVAQQGWLKENQIWLGISLLVTGLCGLIAMIFLSISSDKKFSKAGARAKGKGNDFVHSFSN